MYLVNVRNSMFGGFTIHKFETLDDAQDYVKELYKSGNREVYLSQEIPMKITVSVEF
ncbi:hypothetical protein NST02_23485 [Robertmurraya sp. FSL W8-0741]|uniref:hypothetical protein n=1 Tax=Robertmurraya sp. FSL W8-0741 TaxID=2954629 RepID=UPI0030FD14D7